MSDIFGNDGGFLDWSLNDPVGIFTTGQVASQPNGASVPVNRPAVDTSGESWSTWFDKIVGGAIALRQAYAGDARTTTYPGAVQGVAYAGQPVSGTNYLPILLIGGIALVALYVLKD